MIAFLTALEEMTKIFLLLLTGYFANRFHILPKDAGAGISKLITTILLPALLISTNIAEFQLKYIVSYGQLVLLGGFFWFVITLLSLYPAKRLASNPQQRGVYLYGLSFANTGAVGTPWHWR